jgi:hypothetical protein
MQVARLVSRHAHLDPRSRERNVPHQAAEVTARIAMTCP